MNAACRFLAAVVLAHVGLARPAGAAPVEITADTVWEGAVEVRGEVLVHREATLLVQPGTVVRFAADKDPGGVPMARLVVNGILVAQGTPNRQIVFTSAASDPQPGDWGGILVEHTSDRTSRISHARVEYATTGITGSTASLLVENAAIRNNHTGFAAFPELNGSIFDSVIAGNTLGMTYYQSSAFQVERCEISGNRNGGIGCTMGSSPALRRSTIADNGARGVACIQGSSPLIEGNAIRGHERGIHVELQSRPVIRNNAVTGNATGIWAEKYAFPRILANDIRRNGVGVYCNFASYPEIRGNNLEGNERFSVVVGDNMSIAVEKLIPYRTGGGALAAAPATPEVLPPRTRKFAPLALGENGLVDARGNWWGDGVLAEMERLGEGGNISAIEDFRDKPEVFYFDKPFPRDRVAFSPWEQGPVPGTEPPASPFARITGRVLAAGAPVAGIRVHAYLDASGGFAGRGFTYSAPTADDGSFALNLPAGSYFLVAKGPRPPFPNADSGPGDLFGVCGGNPLAAAAGAEAACTLEAAPLPQPAGTPEAR